MAEQIHDLVIIGGGAAAGHTTAIYAARADLHPIVFEGSVTAGGALYTTTDAENYPGIPAGRPRPRPDRRHAQTSRTLRLLLAS